MKTIYKYTIKPEREFAMGIPKDSRLLTVQTQLIHGNETVQLWALVDTDKELIARKFIAVGTGHELDINTNLDNLRYIGTFQLDKGEVVGHLFEVVGDKE